MNILSGSQAATCSKLTTVQPSLASVASSQIASPPALCGLHGLNPRSAGDLHGRLAALLVVFHDQHARPGPSFFTAFHPSPDPVQAVLVEAHDLRRPAPDSRRGSRHLDFTQEPLGVLQSEIDDRNAQDGERLPELRRVRSPSSRPGPGAASRSALLRGSWPAPPSVENPADRSAAEKSSTVWNFSLVARPGGPCTQGTCRGGAWAMKGPCPTTTIRCGGFEQRDLPARASTHLDTRLAELWAALAPAATVTPGTATATEPMRRRAPRRPRGRSARNVLLVA